MDLFRRLHFWAARAVIAVIESRTDEVKKQIREHEVSIALEIARQVSIPSDSVDVRLVFYDNGMVVPKVEVRVPLSEEQLEELNQIMAVMNPVPTNIAAPTPDIC